MRTVPRSRRCGGRGFSLLAFLVCVVLTQHPSRVRSRNEQRRWRFDSGRCDRLADIDEQLVLVQQRCPEFRVRGR